MVDTEGDRVGQVKEVRDDDFLVDRSIARDAYVPFSECQISDGQVRLKVRASEVDDQGGKCPKPQSHSDHRRSARESCGSSVMTTLRELGVEALAQFSV